MCQNGSIADDERHPCGSGSSLQLSRLFTAKCNYRKVLGSWVLLQASDCRANIIMAGFQICEHQHRFGLFSAFHEGSRVAGGLDPILEVLEAIDQLGAWQQLFI